MARVLAFGWAAHDNSGHLSRFEFPGRKPGPQDVAFTVKYCGICWTDLHRLKNHWKSKYPMLAGHEIVGEVTEVGSEVKRFRAGDHVGVGSLVDSCQTYDFCVEHRLEAYCQDKVETYNSEGFDHNPTYGGYSSSMICCRGQMQQSLIRTYLPYRFVLKIPANLPLAGAAPLLCSGATVYASMETFLKDPVSKEFGVIGLGGLGHLAVKFAKACGHTVTVISTSHNKEDYARNFGVDKFILSNSAQQMQSASKSLDLLLDTVPVAHQPDAYVKLVKDTGTFISLGERAENLDQMHLAFEEVFPRREANCNLIVSIQIIQKMLDFCEKHGLFCDVELINDLNEAMSRLERSDVKFHFVVDIESSLALE